MPVRLLTDRGRATSIHRIAAKKRSRKPISKILHSTGPIGPELPGLPPDRYSVLPQHVVGLDEYAELCGLPLQSE